MNNSTSSASERLDHLLEELRALDSRNLKEIRRWRVIMATIAIMYTILLLGKPSLLLSIEVICLYGFFIIYHFAAKEMSKKNFALPVKELLLNTRRRYSLFRPATLISAVLAVPLIYGGIDVFLRRYLHPDIPGLSEDGTIILVFVLFYLLVLLAAYFAWRYRYAAIRKEIDQNLRDLQEF